MKSILFNKYLLAFYVGFISIASNAQLVSGSSYRITSTCSTIKKDMYVESGSLLDGATYHAQHLHCGLYPSLVNNLKL